MKTLCHFFYTTLFVVAVMSAWSCRHSQPNPVTAEKGSIDFSNSLQLQSEAQKLDGEWEFYYGEFISEKGGQSNQHHPDFIKFPGFWNGKIMGGKPLDGQGFATFRLVILPPKTITSFGLYIPHAFTTYRLFVNGNLVSENGTPGKTANETKEYWLPKASFFHSTDKEIEIILHVSNFKSVNGGFRQSIEFGSSECILNIKQTRLAFDLFLIGCLFVISLYHLSIFVLRKQDLGLLYFSIYSFLALVYQSSTGEFSLVMLFPEINWQLLIRIILNSAFLSFPILLRFLGVLFPNETNRKLHFLFQVLFVLLAGAIFITTSHALDTAIFVGEILVFFSLLYILYILISASMQKRESALGFLFGYIIFFAFTINDILFEKNIVHSEIYAPVGILVLFFSQAFFLSKKFTKLYITIEKQNYELEKNAVLTEKVYQSNIHSKRMELELLKKTIQPHFLMNSLSAIRYWIKEWPDNSIDILDALAGEFRIIQDVAAKKKISIMDEYRLCKYHISVMKMRMEKSYKLSLRGFKGDETIPPLIFHTLLENAFTHEDSANAKLSFCILKKKALFGEIPVQYLCFIVHNHKKSKTKERKPGSGTGMEYIKLRLEESFPGKWKLDYGKSRTGFRVLMQIEEENI